MLLAQVSNSYPSHLSTVSSASLSSFGIDECAHTRRHDDEVEMFERVLCLVVCFFKIGDVYVHLFVNLSFDNTLQEFKILLFTS